jgi:pimeloyl-ACP methyl ester carboxylesterase
MTTTASHALIDVRTWEVPGHLNARGTLFVLTGRGETPEVYQRFASRIASDAYRVVVISATEHLEPQAATEIIQLVADPDQPGPKVLVGADAGARAALELATLTGADAVITAGLPVGGGLGERDWQSEIAARTACPNHQLVLQRSTRHSLVHGVPAVQLVTTTTISGTRPRPLPPSLPVLAVHGSADPLSPLPVALAAYAEIGVSNIWVVDGGLHDILNDVTHRSVAATIVLFLERLRLDPSLPTIIAPASQG